MLRKRIPISVTSTRPHWGGERRPSRRWYLRDARRAAGAAGQRVKRGRRFGKRAKTGRTASRMTWVANTTMFATLRWTTSSLRSSPTIPLAGTRLSDHPIHRESGACCCARVEKPCGLSAATPAAHARLVARSCSLFPIDLACVSDCARCGSARRRHAFRAPQWALLPEETAEAMPVLLRHGHLLPVYSWDTRREQEHRTG